MYKSFGFMIKFLLLSLIWGFINLKRMYVYFVMYMEKCLRKINRKIGMNLKSISNESRKLECKSRKISKD